MKGITRMDVIIKLFQTQWMFLAAAVVIIAAVSYTHLTLPTIA